MTRRDTKGFGAVEVCIDAMKVLTLLLLTLSSVRTQTAQQAADLATLRNEVNMQRALLDKTGFAKVGELLEESKQANKAALIAAIACGKLTGQAALSVSGWADVKFAFSEIAGATTMPNTAKLTSQIRADFNTAKGQLTGNACTNANACGLAQVLLARSINSLSIWTNGLCSNKYYIIYVVKPANKVGQDMNKDGSCPGEGTDQQYPLTKANTKLCQISNLRSADKMTSLIQEVNKERANLGIDGFILIKELWMTHYEKTLMSRYLTCDLFPKIGTNIATPDKWTGVKVAVSVVGDGTQPPTNAQLTAQIRRDFQTAKGQLNAAKTCKDGANGCGLAQILLAPEVSKLYFYTRGPCANKLYLIYTASPPGSVGKRMMTKTNCPSGFTSRGYPDRTSSKKLCQPPTSTTIASALVRSPIVFLLALLSTVLCGWDL